MCWRLDLIVLIGLVIALFLSIGLGAWAVLALLVKNFQFRERLAESEETITILRAAIQRPAIASMTPEQVKDLAELLRQQNGNKPWQN
jgi:hypothetical protein